MMLLDAGVDPTLLEKVVPYGLGLTYLLIGLAAFGMIVGILFAIFQNLKEGGLTALISLVVLIVLFAIGYSMSTDIIPANLIGQQGVEISPSGYKMSSGGLITTYILAFVAFAMMALGLVKGIIQGN